MSKKTNNKKIASTGKKIMSEAKKIRKANPKLKWTTCVAKGAKKIKK